MWLFWLIIFIVSLAVMVKSADWLLEKAEKIGLALGISPFIVGITIVAAGTSFPELISSLMAIWQKAEEIVVANAVGSNVANILLVVGLSVVVGKKLTLTKNLIDLDLPLLAISTALAVFIFADQRVNFIEGLILVGAYIVYLFYTMQDRENENTEIKKVKDLPDIIPSVEKIKKQTGQKTTSVKSRPKITGLDLLLLLAGIIGLFLGSKYLIKSVIELSYFFNINPGLIAITAVALGTSLPELLVSIKAALNGKPEISIGNILGSNVFNLLLVVGIPALITPLTIDHSTFAIGIPAMIAATLLFIVSGISKKIYIWEGLMYLIVYLVFIGKLFQLF